MLALSPGARQGELMRLRWPDIDLERGTAVLHETKNRERRAVPVTGPVLELLRQSVKRPLYAVRASVLGDTSCRLIT